MFHALAFTLHIIFVNLKIVIKLFFKDIVVCATFSAAQTKEMGFVDSSLSSGPWLKESANRQVYASQNIYSSVQQNVACANNFSTHVQIYENHQTGEWQNILYTNDNGIICKSLFTLKRQVCETQNVYYSVQHNRGKQFPN
jgi:hypothetical protein